MKLRYLFLIACVSLLTGCHFSILDPRGVIAASEKKLLIESLLLMMLVVIPVVIMSIVIPYRYRANNTKAVYKPDWAHNNLMEFVWWAIPCVIIFILSVMTWIYTKKLDPYRPLAADKNTVMIEAIALDWKWLFIYPQYHVASVNQMAIPVNVPVRLYITSDAPMNSLEIPRLAGQIYAMTGMQTKLNLMATSIGTYAGLSTNYSGDGFSGMRFAVNVDSLAGFHDWINRVSQSKNRLTLDVYNALTKPSENNPVSYYSGTEPGLFNLVITKYMGPMPGMLFGYSAVLHNDAKPTATNKQMMTTDH